MKLKINDTKPILHISIKDMHISPSMAKSYIQLCKKLKEIYKDEYNIVVTQGENMDIKLDNGTVVNLSISKDIDIDNILARLDEIPKIQNETLCFDRLLEGDNND